MQMFNNRYLTSEILQEKQPRRIIHGRVTDLVLMMSLKETVADERPLTTQWGTPDDASPRLRREDPDGLNETSAWTSSL